MLRVVFPFRAAAPLFRQGSIELWRSNSRPFQRGWEVASIPSHRHCSSGSKVVQEPRTFKDETTDREYEESLSELDQRFYQNSFARRHIGPGNVQQRGMLGFLKIKDLDELVSLSAVNSILLQRELNVPSPLSEPRLVERLNEIANENERWRSYIGMGFTDTIIPSVIIRNVLENPGWITQYTPYQAELSQGRLESLINYQTMICELTGLTVSNASLLDEATACAEAMTLSTRCTKRDKFIIDSKCHPQNIQVVLTRAKPWNIQILVVDKEDMPAMIDSSVAGILLQFPDTEGLVYDYSHLVEHTHSHGGLVTVAADIMGMCLLKPPGEFGADIAVGSTQRFGLPLGYGGPHAGYFAVKLDSKQDKLVRLMPGRIIGLSKDAQGNRAYRLSLQAREQHIRREKATSNICTAQALLANMSAFYAIYHGSNGLYRIGDKIHAYTSMIATGVKLAGHQVVNEKWFDTLTIRPDTDVAIIRERAEGKRINLRYFENGCVGLTMDETVKFGDVQDILEIFNSPRDVTDLNEEYLSHGLGVSGAAKPFKIAGGGYSEENRRRTTFMDQEVFNYFHSETKLIRYIKRLEGKDLSLTHSMIPLGSCTMKLNATTELVPVTWPEFANVHPFAPVSQVKGYMTLLKELDEYLCEITGFDRISFQSNSGAQGEYAGLMAIKGYVHTRDGNNERDVCLIIQSAHGTNPASAVMSGLKCVYVPTDKKGAVDMVALKAACVKNEKTLAALMITYPSTYGVFDTEIRDICNLVHEFGGQVYLDGANMNAQVGLCRPGDYGADVCHLNLHKTFCIPHGGGGPGMGPIGVKKHLTPFLPDHVVLKRGDRADPDSLGSISSCPFGSTLILPISWAYIRLMGPGGLKKASQVALLNANYMRKRLGDHYRVLYTNEKGFCAHEFILDCRGFKKSANIEAVDIAKRLQDYGFHAPTVSFPVNGSLMIEPTESEDRGELDRFCDAMILIRQEIKEIEDGRMDKSNNALKNAPHTVEMVTGTEWEKPYTREKAAFPASFVDSTAKFWPTCARVDDIYGDRNIICTIWQ